MVPLTVVAAEFVHGGGMGLPNLALARRAARRGFPTQLVGYRAAEDLLALPGVSWQAVPRPLGADLLGSPLLSAAGLEAGRRAAARGGRVVVNGGNCPFPDVNWVHYVHAAHRATSHLGPLRDLKFRFEHPVNLLTERLALARARLVIANSERTRKDLALHLGVPPSRITVIRPGIDGERFRPPSEEQREKARERLGFDRRPRLAFVGALSDRRKGFDTLFDAWTRLAERQGFDADLVVLGEGAELDRWRARTRAQKLESRLQFLGFRDDVADVLAACDALVAPVRYESFGRGVQEALCLGLPCIVSRDAGVAECIPPSLGELLLDDAESAEELASRLITWRGNALRLHQAALDASESLRRHGWDEMADQMLALLE